MAKDCDVDGCKYNGIADHVHRNEYVPDDTSESGKEDYPVNHPAKLVRMPFNTDFREKLASGALDRHINQAIENSGQADALNKELGRTENLNIGTQEGKVISLGKYREQRDAKRLMEGENNE